MKRFCRIFVVLFSLPVSVYSAAAGRPLTPAEASAVVQAVEDEIYDSGNYRDFRQLPENIGTPQHWKSRVPIYIDPEYGGEFEGNEGSGEAIYKFMPYGEIVRFFHLSNGQVQLIGNPQNGFPVTQPSHRTLFDDDETICRVKRKWLRLSFVVDVAPPPDVIRQASRRQKVKTKSSE